MAHDRTATLDEFTRPAIREWLADLGEKVEPTTVRTRYRGLFGVHRRATGGRPALSGKANATAEALFGIPGAVATAITEQGASNVQSQAQGVTDRVDEIPPSKNVSIEVDIWGVGELEHLISLQRQVSSFAGSVGSTGTVGLKDGGVVHASRGLMVAGRGASMVADGRGPGLTWAEAATKPRVLPVDESRYARSEPGTGHAGRARAGWPGHLW